MKLLVLFLLLLNACASMIHGSTEVVTISSTPPEALLYVNNTKTGTPAVVWLTRASVHTLVISEPGYDDESFMVTPTLSKWVFGNFLLLPPIGTLIGMFVDFSSGAAWELQPDDIHVNLRRRHDVPRE
jgi:PEGA domain